MRYWPTVNFHVGKVGTLVELPDTPETMIMVRQGLLMPEVVYQTEPITEEDPDVVLRQSSDDE